MSKKKKWNPFRMRKKTHWKFSMPSVFTIILFLMFLIIVATWFPGVVKNSITVTTGGKTTVYHPHKLGLLDMFHAVIQGIQTRADVIAFVLAIGAFIHFILKSQALESGIFLILKKLKGKEIWIIPICIIFFGLGGTIYNMCEETIAYYPIILPILIFAGFDPVTVVLVITFGAGMGVLGSTIAPFSVVIGSSVLGVSALKGIGTRIIIFVLAMTASIVFTMWYAKKVKNNPEKSIVYHNKKAHDQAFGIETADIPFTRKRKLICYIFVMTFFLMILIELPWATFFKISSDKWNGTNGQPGLISLAISRYFPYLATAVFSEVDGGLFIDLATLFLIISVLLGILQWKGEKNHIDQTIIGAKELVGVALIISTAGGVGILLDGNHSGLTYSIAQSFQSSLGHMPKPAFVTLAFLIFIPIAFFIPSSSGFALAVLPLFKNAAHHVGAESGLVTAYISASGFINLFTPAGIPMVCAIMAKINYKEFIQGTWPLIITGFLIPLVVLPLAALAGGAHSSFFF